MRARFTLSLLIVLAALLPREAFAQLDALVNVAACPVSTGYDAAATSIDVVSGCGATLPTAPFNVSWCNVTDYPINCRDASGALDPNYEVVRVTNVSTDTLTITRAQESTSASTKNTSAKTYWISTFTAKTITDINTALGASFLTTASNAVLTNENSGLTAGRVPFIASGPVVADDSEFLWDATSNILKLSSAWAPSRDALGFQVQRTVTTAPPSPPGAVLPIASVRGIFAQSGAVNQGRVGIYTKVSDDASVVNKTITGAADDGSGNIRITATSHGFSNGDRINVYGVGGTTEANGVWTIEDSTTNTFDLAGSTFSNTYTSGGTATNRGLYYGLMSAVGPTLDRGGLAGTGQNGDDVNGLTISNEGTGTGTDAIYVADDSISTGGSKAAWYTILSARSDAYYPFIYTGKIYGAGIDFSGASLATGTEPIMNLGAGQNFAFDTVTGTKIGTSASQKIGFFNATPVVQQTSTVDLKDALTNLGFVATGGATPLNLDEGTLTAGALSVTVSGTEHFAVAATGIPTITTTTTNSAIVNLNSHNSGNTTNTGLVSAVSSGTPSNPLRTQAGQNVMRNSIFGYYAADDVTTATLSSAHRAAFDMLADTSSGTGGWTATDNGTYARLRLTARGTTTTGVKVLWDERGQTLGAAFAARGTTDPTNALTFINGTAPAGTCTNCATLYAGSGELNVMDAAGNNTLLSPHDDATGEWIFYSRNTATGQVLRIDMERLMRRLDQVLGGGFVTEFELPADQVMGLEGQGRLVSSLAWQWWALAVPVVPAAR